MGLGKTLQSVALIYTLLKTGITADGQPTAKRVIVICPCSLVKNWANEFVKWLGQGTVKTLPVAEADRKTVEKNLDTFVRTKMFNVLIASYECIRTHVKRLNKFPDCCDLMVCDEAVSFGHLTLLFDIHYGSHRLALLSLPLPDR